MLGDVVEDVRAFHAFPWKTSIPLSNIWIYSFLIKDLRLPRKCVEGVHVFHNVFQHLPIKHRVLTHLEHLRNQHALSYTERGTQQGLYYRCGAQGNNITTSQAYSQAFLLPPTLGSWCTRTHTCAAITVQKAQNPYAWVLSHQWQKTNQKTKEKHMFSGCILFNKIPGPNRRANA